MKIRAVGIGLLLAAGLWSPVLVDGGDVTPVSHIIAGETVWDGNAASLEDVDAAVREARKAFLAWRRT